MAAVRAEIDSKFASFGGRVCAGVLTSVDLAQVCSEARGRGQAKVVVGGDCGGEVGRGKVAVGWWRSGLFYCECGGQEAASGTVGVCWRKRKATRMRRQV